ncbi:MAG: polyphosphate polymerase domain-containing protein [Actinomycetota bacterium]|nr:polyphosphate polymerase domain-containing protein [Actinomycetota bacterium]
MDKNYRHELKYYINYLDYLKLTGRINGVFTRDSHCRKSGYMVRSLYFDNKSNHSYYHKIAGISDRNKYRIRLYDLNPHPIKLEIKSKSENYIHKQSVAITRDQVFDLISGRYRFLLGKKHPTANLVYAEFSKDHYRPAVVVDYFRDAYFLIPRSCGLLLTVFWVKPRLTLAVFSSQTWCWTACLVQKK